MLDAIIGVGLGVLVGIFPGGSSVLSVFLSATLGLGDAVAAVSAVVAYIVSNIQMAEPNGTPAGMLVERTPGPTKAPQIARQRIAYFAIAFALATPIYFGAMFVLSFSPGAAYVLLALGAAGYVYGPDPVKRRRMSKHLRYIPFLQAGAVAGAVLAMFWLAKQMAIANPVFIVMLAIFSPWEKLFGWDRKRGKERPQYSDMDTRENPLELFFAAPPFSLLSGWSAPMISFFGLGRPSEKEQLKAGPIYDRSKRILLTESIGEGFRLGIAVSSVALGDFSGLSNILEPLKATVDVAQYKQLIVLGVIAGTAIAYALSGVGARFFSRFPQATNIAGYGTLAGTVFGSAGLYALPLIGIGIALAWFLNWTMVEEPQFNYYDPGAPQRARGVTFAFPILLS